MDFAGPDSIYKAIKSGIDLDGSQIPQKIIKLYLKVMNYEEEVEFKNL